MRIQQVEIRHFRSIEHVTVTFPKDRPVVLFGANYAGKSNILEAVDRLLGETYPTHRELKDADRYFYRAGKETTAELSVVFDEPAFEDPDIGPVDTLKVVYNAGGISQNNLLYDGKKHRLHLTQKQRRVCHSLYLRTDLNPDQFLNPAGHRSWMAYFLERLQDEMGGETLSTMRTLSSDMVEALSESPMFMRFMNTFRSSLHPYLHHFVARNSTDPARSGNISKAMNGTMLEMLIHGLQMIDPRQLDRGAQQVWILSLIRAWEKAFPGEHFILLLEEPENHLHPLAQKWLHEYIGDLCGSGMQILIATHSTDFIDLYSFCLETGASSKRVSRQGITDFYATRLFTEQLRGLFSETVLLVEGATEALSLPIFFRRIGFSLPLHGVEIINCEGKSAIPLYARLFRAYGYHVYCLFDGDEKTTENAAMFRGLVEEQTWVTSPDQCEIRAGYAYFGKDYESYFRCQIPDWDAIEKDAQDVFRIPTKPGIARAIARYSREVPSFFRELADRLKALSEGDRSLPE